MKYKIYIEYHPNNYIQSIKDIKNVLKLDLKTAKEAVDGMRFHGMSYEYDNLSVGEVNELRRTGYRVTCENNLFDLPDSLFSIGEQNLNKSIIYNNSILQVVTANVSVSIKLTDEERIKLIKELNDEK